MKFLYVLSCLFAFTLANSPPNSDLTGELLTLIRKEVWKQLENEENEPVGVSS